MLLLSFTAADRAIVLFTIHLDCIKVSNGVVEIIGHGALNVKIYLPYTVAVFQASKRLVMTTGYSSVVRSTLPIKWWPHIA